MVSGLGTQLLDLNLCVCVCEREKVSKRERVREILRDGGTNYRIISLEFCDVENIFCFVREVRTF